MKLFLVFFLAFIAFSESIKVNYRNYKVYNVVPRSEEQLRQLIDLRNQERYDFWTERMEVGKDVKILVSPVQELEFRNYIVSSAFEAEISVSDVQELIDAQRKPTSRANKNVAGDFSFDTYHTLEKIYAWLDELIALYPNVVSNINLGTTFEGRPIRGLKIKYHEDPEDSEPLIAVIEGGIHAREWISPATITGIINEFLTSTNPDVRRLAEAFEWHIIPILNPDGYAYTFSDNRMWRKNRNTSYNTTCSAGNDLSNGVDLNRNFDFVWRTIGASDNPCAETFAGPTAFSELESRAISNHVLTQQQRGKIIYYLAFHSYSQMVLVPYSHVSGYDKLQCENYGDLYEIAIRAEDKLTEKHGTPYLTGTSTEILYSVSGGSFDWAKGVADIPITYLVELRDLGQYGFLLPADQIIANNEEIIEWLLELDRGTRRLHYYQDRESGAGAVFSSLFLMISAVCALVYVN